MGVLDFLFEGSPPPNVGSQTVSSTNMPDWYQEYTRGLLGRSNAIAAQDYQPYTGTRVAEFSDPTQQSFNMAQNAVGIQNPAYSTAQSTLGNVAGGFNQGQFNQYMNPFTSGVNDVIATLGARNLSENILPAVNDTFTGAGQFGGTRNAEFTNRALRDTQQAILQQQAQNMNQGFNQSMQNYLAGQGQGLAAGQALTNLGSTQQASALKDAAAISAIGSQQEAKDQANLDVGYQNFMQQRDWPIQMAQFMNQQIRGFNPPTSTSQSYAGPGSSYQPSPLAQIATGAAGAAAINKMF